MITRDEIVDLLTLAAAYDQRTVGQADIDAWHLVAAECAWTYPLARRCVIEHYKRDGDRARIRPGHVTDRIEAAREEIRRRVFRTDLVPPRELANDPAAELRWRREFPAEYVERALQAWAAGEPLPEIDPSALATETRRIGGSPSTEDEP